MDDDFLRKLLHFRLRVMARKLTVKSYCEKWVPSLYKISVDHPDYKKACVVELSRITGSNYKNILSNWGKFPDYDDAPEYCQKMLAMADAINLTLIDSQKINLPQKLLEKMLDV
jgi:hypothetical protein